MSLRERIVAYIRNHGKARPDDLAGDLPFGRAAIHRNLKKLLEDGVAQKIGKAPTVFYILVPEITAPPPSGVAPEIKNFLDKDYLYISPQGYILPGYAGFLVWLKDIKQEGQAAHLAQTYVHLRHAYNQHRSPEGWIDGTKKLRNTFGENVFLNRLLFADFYSLAQFGKTKLGTLMLYAKQSQNRDLAKKVILEIKPLVNRIIADFKVGAVAYIPPSIPRNVQFITLLAKHLNLPLPKISLIKSRAGQVVVAQKTLEKLEQRIVNARETIFVKDIVLPFKNILLIDDAVGSGASLNETAKKLKPLLPPSGKIFGFAITGSYKGFDVIREV